MTSVVTSALRFTITALFLFSTHSWAVETSIPFSGFEIGAGHWSAKGIDKSTQRPLAVGRLTLGYKLNKQSSSFAFIRGESFRVFGVPTQTAAGGQHRHNIEGVSAGFGWNTGLYQAWLSYGGGRWRVEENEGHMRYDYRSPAVGLGLAMYHSASASLNLYYTAQQLLPKNELKNAVGYENSVMQYLTLAIHIFVEDVI